MHLVGFIIRTKSTTLFIKQHVWYASPSQPVNNKVFIIDHFSFWDVYSRSTDQQIPNSDAAWRLFQCSREPVSETNLSQLKPVHIIPMCYLRSSWYPAFYSHIYQTIAFFTCTAHFNVPLISFASIVSACLCLCLVETENREAKRLFEQCSRSCAVVGFRLHSSLR